MAKIAMIKNNSVENIAVWEDDQAWKASMESAGYSLVDVTDRSDIDMGWSYDGSSFSNPNASQE